MRVPAHEATTAQLGAAYPFVATRPLLERGVLVGRDLHGGAFVHDPFALYGAGLVTNPNLLVLGQIGRGKSALLKTYLYRHAAFGRRIVVLDPKGEYGPLAAALDSVPVRLAPGGRLRVNPLDGHEGPGRDGRRLSLLAGLAATSLGRPLEPAEHAGLEPALAEASARAAGRAPTIVEVVESLLDPPVESARALRTDREGLRSETRSCALALRRLVRGELAGIFDGLTSPGLRLDGPAVILDLSALFRSPALPALVACAVASLEPGWREAARRGQQSLLVVDEAWAVLDDLGVARFLQSSWKLARANGVANMAVVHRVSDLAASGPRGSVAAQVAEGLLADSETLVCYAQSASEVSAASEALGLNEREAGLLSRLPRGVALWRVGGRTHLVEHRIGPDEVALVDTDSALRAGT
ncbi:MAG: ATP/GTP-binding protein [Acidimicrobiaceae bacterium]|nr:ATP/GTP-binding protein [Acidimicrobiaceae bacterium]